MLCDVCQEKEAVVNYTEITPEGRKEKHLCLACAAKESGIVSPFVSLTDPGFLANFFKGMWGQVAGEQKAKDDESLKKTNLICPSCNMTYNEFLKFGKFGCSDCYKTFHFILDGYMKKVQGSCEHTGKHPVYSGETMPIPVLKLEDPIIDKSEGPAPIDYTIDESSSIEELKAALKRAVGKEEYEEAARIRDMIRAEEGAKEHA